MVAVSNVADVMTARSNPDYAEALKQADIVAPDGVPIVWAMREDGYDIQDRVYGPDLMAMVLEDPELATRRHVLVGATEAAREGVRACFPEINWVGEVDPDFAQLEHLRMPLGPTQESGCFRPTTYEELSAWLNAQQADVIWLSLGGGRQVQVMARLKPMLKHGTMLWVGAAFDFHAGLLPQAPRWMQRRGLESAFRLFCEPRRLWRRYLVLNPPFFWHRWREKRRRASQDLR